MENTKKVSSELELKIKLMETEKRNLQLQMENIHLKGNQINQQIQADLMQEKMKLNIPNDWIYNLEMGLFVSPEEHKNMIKAQQAEQQIPINAEIVEDKESN